MALQWHPREYHPGYYAPLVDAMQQEASFWTGLRVSKIMADAALRREDAGVLMQCRLSLDAVLNEAERNRREFNEAVSHVFQPSLDIAGYSPAAVSPFIWITYPSGNEGLPAVIRRYMCEPPSHKMALHLLWQSQMSTFSGGILEKQYRDAAFAAYCAADRDRQTATLVGLSWIHL